MQNYYLHHEKHEEHEEVFKFSAQAENKKTYFSDFPCLRWLIYAFSMTLYYCFDYGYFF